MVVFVAALDSFDESEAAAAASQGGDDRGGNSTERTVHTGRWQLAVRHAHSMYSKARPAPAAGVGVPRPLREWALWAECMEPTGPVAARPRPQPRP